MATILTADGCAEFTNIRFSDGCCPVPLSQLDPCSLTCSFIELLPTGPLWDRAKAEALTHYRANPEDTTCSTLNPGVELSCQSMVAYAVCLSRVLLDILQNGLAVALRESSPETAVTTLDDWLVRLGWQDCFATQCRSVMLGTLTPLEIMGECGPIFCPVATPEDLECAVKRGIVRALVRAQMGGIKNLCWVNWVIEPLGARIEPRNTATYIHEPDEPCVGQQFTIGPSTDVLMGCDGEDVPAEIILDPCTSPAGLPPSIYPGVVAAECIARSLLPVAHPNNIFRSC